MPRYTYECGNCGHVFEKLEGWDAPVQQPCPTKCSKGKGARTVARRIPQAPMIVFRGAGFYRTDNPGKGAVADQVRDERTERLETGQQIVTAGDGSVGEKLAAQRRTAAQPAATSADSPPAPSSPA